VTRISDAAKAEIAEAVRILREDGVHIHKSYAAFKKSQEETPPTDAPTEGTPPPDPPKDPKADETPEPPKKKSAWWGDRLND
jgi:hypothetical protein